jgi:hypothetical protein
VLTDRKPNKVIKFPGPALPRNKALVSRTGELNQRQKHFSDLGALLPGQEKPFFGVVPACRFLPSDNIYGGNSFIEEWAKLWQLTICGQSRRMCCA